MRLLARLARRWAFAARSLAVVAPLGAAPLLGACAAHTGAAAPVAAPERALPPQPAVTDDDFSGAVHDLLLSAPGSAERAVRLGAVEARQMTRAASRFRARSSDRGVVAVSGGLYLARVGESLQGMLGPDGPEAIRGAVRELASRGDEGRSRALYDLLMQVAPDADTKAHVAALDTWTRDAVLVGGPLESAGALERVTVRRRLLESSDAALADAVKATEDWLAKAVALRERFRRNKVQPAREEGAEAWRALETGPLVLAALHLRDANPAGALAAIDHAQVRDMLEGGRPQFAVALEVAAQERTADRCVGLLAQLRTLVQHEPGREEEEFTDDRDTFGAAAFAMATECYRLDPTAPQVALSLGVALEELGLAEAAPAVLGEMLRAHPDPKTASEVLALSLDAMAIEEDAGDTDAARRAYKAASPLLDFVSGEPFASAVHPSAARLRAAMGEIDLREGRIDEARELLKRSAAEEKSGAVLLSLARIEWRDGQTQPAMQLLSDALSAQDAARDPALRGEVLLLMSDLARDKGDAAGVRTPLTEALKELVQSRGAPNTPNAPSARNAEIARVERVLSRVLDRFGAAQPAQRALERAYAAAPGDRRQAAQTIELLVGRAFVRGDLPAAREGLQRALGSDLEADDLVYFALWVRLLERQLHAAPDAAVDRVFASVPEDGRWVATLARFGEGKIKGDDLVAGAKTPIQKYEALFYTAMDHRAAGDTKGGDDLLRQVVAGTGVELSEMNLARDLLDPGRSQVAGPLPPDVAVP
jgi:tetratricopeptide (TPR) repeat protein